MTGGKILVGSVGSHRSLRSHGSHGSHGSHRSHGSHGSHRSHGSHGSHSMLLCECCDIFCDFIFSDKLGNIVINKWKIGIRIKDEQYINHILHPFCWCSSTLLLRCMQ